MAIILSATFPGDGTTLLFNIPFDYDDQSQVIVTLSDGTSPSFTFNSPTQIKLAVAVPVGKSLTIYRKTDIEEPEVTFNTTSGYNTNLFNKALKQVLWGVQESFDYSTRSVNTEKDARIAADNSEQSARIAADSAEQSARISADNTEQAARIAADNAEQTARIAGDNTTYANAVSYTNSRTKADIGLGNVDNTSDANKPVSTAQAAADAATLASAKTYTDSKANKASVGLGNVDNTSDANKPVSTAQAAAISSGDAATLVSAKSYADTQDATNLANAKAYTDSKATKAAIGLGNVDNTSDANKPVSTATQTALDAKANTASLGSAAYANTSAFATSAQGSKADSAVQSIVAGTNISINNSDPRNPIISSVGGGSGGGDVFGPSSSVGDGEVVVFDGTTGKLLKSAGATFSNVAKLDVNQTWTAQQNFGAINAASGNFTSYAFSVTEPVGTNNTRIATTAFVQAALNNIWSLSGFTATFSKNLNGFGVTASIINSSTANDASGELKLSTGRANVFGLHYVKNDTSGQGFAGIAFGANVTSHVISVDSHNWNKQDGTALSVLNSTGYDLKSGIYKTNGTQLGYGNGLTGFASAATYSTGTTANTIPVLDGSAKLPIGVLPTVSVTYGGTGITSYAVGDLLYANSSSSLDKLASVATGNALISGGAGAAPAWGKIGLTTHVTGTLSVANGGTGQTTYTVGDILYADGTGSLAKLPSVAGGNVLRSGGVGAAPSYGKVGLTTHVTGTLPAANGGTGITNDVTICSIPFIVDGGGVSIQTGLKGDIVVDFDCQVLGWTVLGDATGSLVVDIWKDTYANYPPVVGDTITGTDKPTLSSAAKAQSTALTGWTTTIPAGSILRYNVDSVSGITRATISLKVKRV